MIEANFRSLSRLIVSRVPPDGVGPPSDFVLPVFAGEVQAAIDVLNEIERDHDRDVARNVRRYVPSADTRTWKPNWEERVERIRPRELYRTVAYLMYWTTLDGVVRQIRSDLLTKFRSCDEEAATRLEARQEVRQQLLRDEIAVAVRVRHKVFAHTSFAKPWGDSKSMQLTSIQYLVGNPYGWGPEGLVFGGSFTLDAEERPELQPLGVFNLSRKAAPSLAGWCELIDEAVRAFADLSDEKIVGGLEYATAVRRELRPSIG